MLPDSKKKKKKKKKKIDALHVTITFSGNKGKQEQPVNPLLCPYF